MKTTRLVIGIFLPLMCCLLCSCSSSLDGDYECDIDKVESVQIVQLDDLVTEECRYNYTVLGEVLDKTAFLSQLNALETKPGSSPPKTMKTDYVVIKINYSNGGYDLIYRNVQWNYRADANPIEYFVFDEGQFNDLLNTCLRQGGGSVVP